MRAFRVAYDGRPFHGFQRQPDVPTVEDRLLAALSDLGVLAGDRDVPEGWAAAGRTDAGVSALAQTVAFDAPEWLTPRAFNGELPGTIRAWAAAEAPAGFHATHDATRREYVYFLFAPDADDERARAALDALRGDHDFRNLTPDETGTVRTLDGDLSLDGEFLVVTLSADGFARQLVRRAVSLVRAVATGDAPLAKVERVLRAERIEGPEGIPPAPAAPLVLADVDYPGLDFERDGEAAASARDAFGERRRVALARSRVADFVAEGVGAADGTR